MTAVKSETARIYELAALETRELWIPEDTTHDHALLPNLR